MSERECRLSCPSRRELLRWGLGCGAMFLPQVGRAQDVAGAGPLPGPTLEGVARHEAMFWEKRADKKVLCTLCPRGCEVADVERGYCGVRENQGGKYQTLVYGALCATNVDPIEKKPLFHYLPGTTAFSIATAGCNIECKFCQNWRISQFRPEQVQATVISPERLVATCRQQRSPTIAYTYSEPVVFYEYMHDSAATARKQGVGAVMISNGYIQEKPLRQLCRHLTGVKIDFKAFSASFYKKHCRGKLEPVLDTLKILKAIGIWFELVILIIPTLNDDPGEVAQMSRWVVDNLGPDVPMHFTRFHPTYRMKNLPRTPISILDRCRRVAMKAGVYYVYAGNVPGHDAENTKCHHCGRELIRRMGFRVVSNDIRDGKCPGCKTAIPGVWSQTQALAFKPRKT